jgi:hypothetical protein
VSQQKRKRLEEVFGWVKTVALLRKTHHRGVRRVGWLFTLAAALYNLADSQCERGAGDRMSREADDRTGCGTPRERREAQPRPAGIVLSAVRSSVSHRFSAAC